MLKLGNGSIMAVLLADNGVEEGNANFISAVYSISNDGGKTWSGIKHIDKSEMLQFDVNIFELNDKLLLTWSEGNVHVYYQRNKYDIEEGMDLEAITKVNGH